MSGCPWSHLALYMDLQKFNHELNHEILYKKTLSFLYNRDLKKSTDVLLHFLNPLVNGIAVEATAYMGIWYAFDHFVKTSLPHEYITTSLFSLGTAVMWASLKAIPGEYMTSLGVQQALDNSNISANKTRIAILTVGFVSSMLMFISNTLHNYGVDALHYPAVAMMVGGGVIFLSARFALLRSIWNTLPFNIRGKDAATIAKSRRIIEDYLRGERLGEEKSARNLKAEHARRANQFRQNFIGENFPGCGFVVPRDPESVEPHWANVLSIFAP